MVSSLEATTLKLLQQLQKGGLSQQQIDSKQLEQLQQLQHFFDQQQTKQSQSQQGGQQSQQAGSVKVYTGPKEGKFIINKQGKKVYIDRKSLANNLQYQKAKPKPKTKKAAKKPNA
jgi:hypothetical protein